MLWNKPDSCCNMMPSDPCMNVCEPMCQYGPVYEKPIEKCLQKNILHEVQHGN